MGTRKAAERLRPGDGKLEDQQRRFDESGQSAVAFCRDEGIPVSTFYQRRARLKKLGQQKRGSPSATRFIDAGALVVSAPTQPTRRSDSVTELKQGVEVRIDLGGGVVVHITRT
jgi:hypothetical protein